MIFKQTKLNGVYVIEPDIKEDNRGYFTRIFCQNELKENQLSFNIAQINRSLTKKRGTIRGLHYQKEPFSEDKIVQVLQGAVYDVALDLRKKFPNFGLWIGEKLSAENKKMLFIPKGFAHGFQTLTSDCEVLYLMSEFYSPEHASGVRFDDHLFKINWPIKNPILSEKDKNWPRFKR